MFIRIVPVLIVFAVFSSPAVGQVQTFENDFLGFEAAAGELNVIDFESFGDGSPSVGGTPITESFNYDALGVHFSNPMGTLAIGGSSSNHRLRAESPLQTVSSIHAELLTPGSAIGGFFPGTTELCAYGLSAELIGCVMFGQPGNGNFIGIVSPTTPTKTAVFSRGSNLESIEGFVFVPEPASSVLWAGAAGMFLRRRSARRAGARRLGQ